MTLLPANFGAQRRDGSSEQEPDAGRGAVGLKDLTRLSVGTDGRLYWDEKPVLIKRRLVLSGWQTLGVWLVGLAAFVIAFSGGINAAITAHDWMCGVKWVSNYCPTPPPPPPGPPVRIELPN
jgi:hypothetical protein